jgi:hypothetical protein
MLYYTVNQYYLYFMLPVLKPKLTQVQQHEFIKGRFSGLGKDSALVGWVVSDFDLPSYFKRKSTIVPCLCDLFILLIM